MDHYDFREGRILNLTRGQALQLLGFPASASPSEAELKTALKSKALELHPDRGGTLEAMQDVNRAFDFLMKSQDSDSSYDHRDPDSGQEAFRPEDVLNRELEPFPKKHAWWSPGKNLAVNVTLMGGVNLWFFSIMPSFYRDIYRPARNGKPEGIVIDPGWHPTDDHIISSPTPDIMYRCCKAAKDAEPVGDSVKRQLKSIESKFSIQIPAAVEAKLVKDADKVAKRRWGVDRLRARKILVPFDGSKAIELGSWA